MKIKLLLALLVLLFGVFPFEGCVANERELYISEEDSPPESLKDFWGGMREEWLPRSKGEFWTKSQTEKVRAYCKKFAKNHAPEKIIPELIKDLKTRGTEFRTFIYVWIVVNWEPKKVTALLMPYYSGTDSVEQRIAGDFLAEVEEMEKESAHQPFGNGPDGLRRQ